MSKNQRCQDLVDAWLPWLRSRRFYGPHSPLHILAVLSMPDTRKGPPDADLSEEMAAFNIGVMSLPASIGRPFIRIYCGWPDEYVKVLAHREGVALRTYYDRADEGAKQVLVAMNIAMRMVENLKVLHCADINAQKLPAHIA